MSARTAVWDPPTSTKRTPEPTRIREDLARIYSAAVEAVDPTRLVVSHLTRPGAGAEQASWRNCLVVGAGKAAARMAAGCEAALGAANVRGLVLTAEGCTVALRRIESVETGHPMPDERGLSATARLRDQLAAATEPVIVLISGGASALMVQPAPPVSLDEKVAVTTLLLRCAASIEEVNSVRKHLSLVKGGGLLRWCRSRPMHTLMLSDVIGDDPSVIGSGPTMADPTTFADALGVLRRYELEMAVPASVRDRLRRGAQGEIDDTVKPGATVEQGASHVLLGNNALALQAGATAASRLGYRTVVIPRPLLGDTGAAARGWLREVQGLAAVSAASPWCIISGGETTVNVQGAGRGGRNQEFALALVDALAGSDVSVLSAGTDGIDGPTDAAGAFVNQHSAARARQRGLDPAAALAQNDSFTFFSVLDDLFVPGPTGTNVADIKIAIGGS